MGKKLGSRIADRVAHFWNGVDRSGGPEACWPWTRGKKCLGGYGEFWDGERRFMTHRYAFLCATGSLTPGLVVRHRCDNPPCCNPAHLLEGTHVDNAEDMLERGREVKREHHWTILHPERILRAADNPSRKHPEKLQRGTDRPHHKLSEESVRSIRAEHETGAVSQRALAAKYGVSRGLVFTIVHRQRWKHI